MQVHMELRACIAVEPPGGGRRYAVGLQIYGRISPLTLDSDHAEFHAHTGYSLTQRRLRL
jgi:hypothetical protein